MVHVVTSAGIGDACLALQASFYINEPHKNHICARDEVVKPLQYAFKDYFHLIQWPEEYVKDYKILFDKEIQDTICGNETDERYFVLPDLLFRGPLAFDYKKYNTNPSLIRSTRLLTNRYKPENNKIISCFLASTTPGYLYDSIGELLRQIGQKLPDYTIFFPKVSSWAGKSIEYGDLDNLPSNVVIEENPDIYRCIDIIAKSEFAICADNGPSHLFFQYGCPRLVLDPNWNRIPWTARWKSCLDEYILIHLPAELLSNLIEVLIKEPVTQLIPRIKLLEKVASNDYNWKDSFLLKF